jgi:hypothetical protein
VARALPKLPRIAQALARGELSYSKVRALTRVATPERKNACCKFAKCGTAAHVERLVRGWAPGGPQRRDQEAAQRHKSRRSYVYQDEDGMFVIRGRLTPESAQSSARPSWRPVCDRLHVKTSMNPPEGLAPSVGNYQADALGMIAEAALAP